MATIGELDVMNEQFVFEWRLKDFLSLSTRVDKFYYSPSFAFTGEIWCLQIFPNGETKSLLLNGETKNTGSYINIYVCRTSSGPPISLGYSLGLQTVNGKLDLKYNDERIFESNQTYGFYCFIKKSKLLERKSELLPSNVLSVVCELKHPKSSKIQSDTNASGSSEVYRHDKILQDFKQLFLNKENCDVVLRVKGQEFQAHKAILTVRSPVFASTFRHDMKEKETGIVDIEDVDPSIFPDFLCFLYSNDVESLSEENVFGLFNAADKYDIQDLRKMCLKFMKDNLSIKIFCETLTLALQHSETDLINLTTNFFIRNAEKILVTIKWQSFAAVNPTQSNELFIKFVASVKDLNT